MLKTQISNMSNIEVLKELKDRELLKPLVMAGIIAPTVLRNMEIYYSVDAKVQTGTSKTKAVKETASCFNVEVDCVWKAIKRIG